jgi:hypothetical protein
MTTLEAKIARLERMWPAKSQALATVYQDAEDSYHVRLPGGDFQTMTRAELDALEGVDLVVLRVVYDKSEIGDQSAWTP